MTFGITNEAREQKRLDTHAKRTGSEGSLQGKTVTAMPSQNPPPLQNMHEPLNRGTHRKREENFAWRSGSEGSLKGKVVTVMPSQNPPPLQNMHEPLNRGTHRKRKENLQKELPRSPSENFILLNQNIHEPVIKKK